MMQLRKKEMKMFLEIVFGNVEYVNDRGITKRLEMANQYLR